MNAFNDASNALLEPGMTVQKAMKVLDSSRTAFESDVNAFKEISEDQVALDVSRLAEVIVALEAAIQSSGSVEAGIRSQLADIQTAVVELGQVDAVCP